MEISEDRLRLRTRDRFMATATPYRMGLVAETDGLVVNTGGWSPRRRAFFERGREDARRGAGRSRKRHAALDRAKAELQRQAGDGLHLRTIDERTVLADGRIDLHRLVDAVLG